jgi:hypothetical protein
MRRAFLPLKAVSDFGEITDVAQARLFKKAPAFIVDIFARLALNLAKAGTIVPVRFLFELGLSPNTFITIVNGKDVQDVSLNRSPGYFRVSLFHAMVLATRGEYMITKLCLCYQANCAYITDYSLNGFIYPHRVLWDLALFGNRLSLYTAYLYSPYFAMEPAQYGEMTNDPMTALAYLRTRYYEGFEEGPYAEEIREFLTKAAGYAEDEDMYFNHDLVGATIPVAEQLRRETAPRAQSAADRYEALLREAS